MSNENKATTYKISSELLSRADLQPIDKLVLMYIRGRPTGDDNWLPSLRDIAKGLGVEEPAALWAIGRLLNVGTSFRGC